MLYINFNVYHFLRFVVIFLKFFEFFIIYFVCITRVRSTTPRPMWNSVLRVGSRDRDFKLWMLLMARLSTHILQKMSFLRLNSVSTAHRLKLFLINFLANSSSTCPLSLAC